MKSIPVHVSASGIVYLQDGAIAIVSKRDVDTVRGFHWRTDKIGKCVYAVAFRPLSKMRGKKKVYMHNLILGVPTDHKNGSGLDNRRSNIRPADKSQNAKNCWFHRAGHKRPSPKKK